MFRSLFFENPLIFAMEIFLSVKAYFFPVFEKTEAAYFSSPPGGGGALGQNIYHWCKAVLNIGEKDPQKKKNIGKNSVNISMNLNKYLRFYLSMYLV